MEHQEPAVHQQTTKSITYMQNRYYNWKLWGGEDDLDGRKYSDIILASMYKQWLLHCIISD